MEKIVFVQYGNYQEAFHNFKDGKQQNYRDQKLSVEFVESLSNDHSVTVIAICEDEHDIFLNKNLRSIGIKFSNLSKNSICNIFNQLDPSLMVCRTPNIKILSMASNFYIRTLATFADIFLNSSIRSSIDHFRLRNLLTKSNICSISNHNINATKTLVSVLKLPPSKVLAWDWSKIPDEREIKNNINDLKNPVAFFAGGLSKEKGVSDCLDAIAFLQKNGINLHMSFAGNGDLQYWKNYSKSLNIESNTKFLGMIENRTVKEYMKRSDFVIVPSRHAYPEGLPNVIYEALASKSPIILSNHPAFEGRLKDMEEAIFFKAESPKSLCDSVIRLIEAPELYRLISTNSENAHRNLYFGIEWISLVQMFIDDPYNRTNWVERTSTSIGIQNILL